MPRQPDSSGAALRGTQTNRTSYKKVRRFLSERERTPILPLIDNLTPQPGKLFSHCRSDTTYFHSCAVVRVLLSWLGMKTVYAPQVAKYLARRCPKCAGYFGVIVSRLPYRSSIRAVSGWCKHCNYQIAWALVVRGKERTQTKPARGYQVHGDR